MQLYKLSATQNIRTTRNTTKCPQNEYFFGVDRAKYPTTIVFYHIFLFFYTSIN